jgi:hypothetical protein
MASDNNTVKRVKAAPAAAADGAKAE